MSNYLSRRQILNLTSGFIAGAAATGSIPLFVNKSFAQIFPAPIPPSIPKDWQYLISFRPPTTVQNSVNQRFSWILKPSVIEHIENAYGEINLDYYPVAVSNLPTIPTIPGRAATAEEFLSYIRLNINNFVDSGVSAFEPYDNVIDNPKWNSSSPLDAVIHIDLRIGSELLNPDDGSVVVSEFAPDHWIFSTIWAPRDLDHPVSGNRQFGFQQTIDTGAPNKTIYIFYTRGADRITGFLDNLVSSIVFSSADKLWRSLQTNISNFVNTNGGLAVSLNPISDRFNWDDIKKSYYFPTTPWV